MTSIFDPVTLGGHKLPNRIIMAPMTRGRAEPNAIPGKLMAEYYVQRAEAGLIITEATAISPQGHGWLNAPGIWNDAHIQGWRTVTDAVHAAGGRIFLQLWHMGRVSHPDFLDGKLPVAPSAIAAQGDAQTANGKKAYVTPRELTIAEIKSTVADYASAAVRAMAAGFDGVEIHGANGYLIDQFIKDGTNKRTDTYGGKTKNRLRFLQEVVEAVTDAVGSGNVGVRLSPTSHYNDMYDSDPVATFTMAAEMLNPFNLAYVHTLEPLPGHMLAAEGERVTPHIRKIYKGKLITNGGYDFELGSKAIEANEADAIAFGLPFLANPDLITRFRNRTALNHPDFATLYTPGQKGYTDYLVSI